MLEILPQTQRALRLGKHAGRADGAQSLLKIGPALIPIRE